MLLWRHWPTGVDVGLHDLVYLLTDVVATEQGTYILYATLLKSWAVSRTTLVRPTSKWLSNRRCESVDVSNYLSCVKTQYRPTFKWHKLMGNGGSSEDREEQEKARKICSCRRRVKPAGAAERAATIRSKELASCYSRPNSVSSTPAIQFAPFPPAFPGCARRGEEQTRQSNTG